MTRWPVASMTRAFAGRGPPAGDDGRDAIALDEDRATFQDQAGLVHHDNGAAVDEEGGVVLGGGWG